MPLSEHEQRLLDQIERALYQEDPKFASTVRATDLRTHMRRRLRRAALVLILGFAILLTGLTAFQGVASTAVGVAGFVVMVGALLLAMTSWRRLQPGGADLHVVGGADQPDRSGRPRQQQSKRAGGGSFKGKLEERWKRRWDERGNDGR